MRKLASYILISLLLGTLLACSYDRFFSSNNAAPSSQEWQRFIKAYAMVKNYYVKPTTDSTLMDNAINGMLQGLDEYSVYIPKQDMSFLDQITTGEFSGIGIDVIPTQDALKVVTPLDDSPAKKAGILPDDEIIDVDNKPIAEMTLREAIEALRGPKGTQVELTVIRASADKPLKFTLTREVLKVKNITTKLLAHNIGYIRIMSFQDNTPENVQKAILSFKSLNGLIVDLRNNPGGVLQSATGVSNLFLTANKLGKNKLIVYSKDRNGTTVYSADADSTDIIPRVPMVILINKGSASGAEIVAAALHDHHRATLVGMKTFGKGSVQTVFPLGDGAVKLTTALYYAPNGETINHIGIAPDVEVKMVPNAKPDVQLERAEKILN